MEADAAGYADREAGERPECVGISELANGKLLTLAFKENFCMRVLPGIVLMLVGP